MILRSAPPLTLLALLPLSLACGGDDAPADTDGATSSEATSLSSTGGSGSGTQSGSGTTGRPSTAGTDPTQGTGTTAEASTTAGDGESSETGSSSGETGESRTCGAAFDVEFSTYFGRGGWEHTRDVFVDGSGNIYLAGGTASSDFPTTAGAYDTTFNTGGSQIGGHGPSDAWVAMFSPGGQLVWATYLGGPNYDRAYAIEVAEDGHVYVSGRSGPGFPTTPGVFQPEYLGVGTTNDFYGVQNGFIAKLSPDGSELVWSSQFGVNTLVRDFDIDDQGDVYAVLSYDQNVSGDQAPAWFAGAFDAAYQPARNGGHENGLAKVSSDGTTVLWATWLGGSGNESGIGSVRVDAQRRPYTSFYTDSSDIPTTTGNGASGGQDVYVARLSTDGAELELGTYVGGSGDEGFETHGLAVAGGEIVLAGFTTSTDFPVTAGAFQTAFGGGPSDAFAVRMDEAGTVLAATYFGGSGFEGPDGLNINAAGEVAFVGETDSADLPVSAAAHQPALGGDVDVFVVVLGSDFSSPRYASFLGGTAHENGRAAFITDDCDVFVAGASSGPGWPTTNAYQADFAGGGQNWGNGDNILAKLVVTP